MIRFLIPLSLALLFAYAGASLWHKVERAVHSATASQQRMP